MEAYGGGGWPQEWLGKRQKGFLYWESWVALWVGHHEPLFLILISIIVIIVITTTTHHIPSKLPTPTTKLLFIQILFFRNFETKQTPSHPSQVYIIIFFFFGWIWYISILFCYIWKYLKYIKQNFQKTRTYFKILPFFKFQNVTIKSYNYYLISRFRKTLALSFVFGSRLVGLYSKKTIKVWVLYQFVIYLDVVTFCSLQFNEFLKN